MTMVTAPETAAAAKTLAQARKSGLVRPCGREDSAGRWYPAPEEACAACCEGIRTPSRAWPRSIRAHCASGGHCQHLVAEYPEAFARALVEAEAAEAEWAAEAE